MTYTYTQAPPIPKHRPQEPKKYPTLSIKKVCAMIEERPHHRAPRQGVRQLRRHPARGHAGADEHHLLPPPLAHERQ